MSFNCSMQKKIESMDKTIADAGDIEVLMDFRARSNGPFKQKTFRFTAMVYLADFISHNVFSHRNGAITWDIQGTKPELSFILDDYSEYGILDSECRTTATILKLTENGNVLFDSNKGICNKERCLDLLYLSKFWDMANRLRKQYL